MVREVRTYFTDEKITEKMLSEAQMVADREVAIALSQEGCTNCTLRGDVNNLGQFIISCASRSYDSHEVAVDQETVCQSAHQRVLAIIDSQAEFYTQDLMF
jgi:hypothetical protein